MRDLYLCGPMDGYPNGNAVVFRTAARDLRAAGFTVHSPGELDEADGKSWLDYMRESICLLMDCRAVAYLPGTRDGRGPRAEAQLARDLGLPVRPIADWIQEGPQ